MIAIGSAISTGLFLGAGGRLHIAGPSLALLYWVCGFFGYLMLRCLGELVVYRPSSGSFVSYAREFFGEKVAFVTGWLYWFNWAMTCIADSTALAIYFRWFGQYLDWVNRIPQAGFALFALVSVLALNLMSVKMFGEMEFWFSVVKVSALLFFLGIGTYFVIFGTPNGSAVGFHLITNNGGMFPHGVLPALVVVQGIVFAYMGIELIGTTSGEAQNPEAVIPRAINMVMLRIVLFYFGSVLLLCLLLPYTAYKANESPFVTFFASIGVGAAAPITQLAIMTAAFSSMNAGLYSTGRVLHSMAMASSAPKFMGHISKSGVPTGGILATFAVALIGVVLNYLVPNAAFEIVINLTAIGVITAWGTIVACHLKFVALTKQGLYERPHYQAFLTPFTNWLTFAFLAAVIVLMGLDYPIGTYSLAASVLLIPTLIIGWRMVRTRVTEISHAKIAERPASSAWILPM